MTTLIGVSMSTAAAHSSLGDEGMLASHRAFLTSLAAELRLRDPDGTRLQRLGDVGSVSQEAAALAVGAADSWTRELGGFYDVEGVRKLLSRGGRPVSKQAISKRHGLLALKTGSGRVVYPSFQFHAGEPLAGLGNVLSVVPETLVSRWTLASWLVSPQAELAGVAPVALLREGVLDPVLLAAQSWAAALAA